MNKKRLFTTQMEELMLKTSVFNDALKDEVKSHEEFFKINEDAYFIPQLHILALERGKEAGELCSLLVLLGGDNFKEDKFKMIFEVGRMIMRENKFVPLAVILSSEAWMRYAGPGEEDDGDVEKYDDKTESLVTVGLTVDGRQNMAVTKITRVGKNNVVFLGETHFTLCEEDARKRKSFGKVYLVEEFFRGCVKEKFNPDERS